MHVHGRARNSRTHHRLPHYRWCHHRRPHHRRTHHWLAKHRKWMHHDGLLRRNSINDWGRLAIPNCLSHDRLSRVHSTIIAGTRLPLRRDSSYIALRPISLARLRHLASPINQACNRWKKKNSSYRAYHRSYEARSRGTIARWLSALRFRWWVLRRWRADAILCIRGGYPIVVVLSSVSIVIRHLRRVVAHVDGLVLKGRANVQEVRVDFPVIDAVHWDCLDLGGDAL